jgi:hypothetical protein
MKSRNHIVSQASQKPVDDFDQGGTSEGKPLQTVDPNIAFSSPTIPRHPSFSMPPSVSPSTLTGWNRNSDFPSPPSLWTECISKEKLTPRIEQIMYVLFACQPQNDCGLIMSITTFRHIADSVYARTEYIREIRAVRDFKRLKQSWRYSHLNEGDKARLDIQLADLEFRCENRKKRLNSAFALTLQSDGNLVKWGELTNWVAEIHGSASKTLQVFNKKAKAKSPSESGVGRSVGLQNSLECSPTDSSTTLWDSFQIFASRLADFEVSVAHQYQDLVDEVDTQIAAKLAKLDNTDLTPLCDEGQLDGSDATTKAAEQFSAKLYDVGQQAKHSDEQVGQINEEVRNLLLQSKSRSTVSANVNLGIELAKSNSAAVSWNRQIS